MDQDAIGRLAEWLSRRLAAPVELTGLNRLSGGAIQENWVIEADVGGAPRAFVLRRDAPATIAASHSRREEFALLQVAHRRGVLVPEPVAFCDDAAVIGRPFALMARVAGTGFGPRIVKETTLGGEREALAREIGRQLALIHAIRPPEPALSFLGPPPADPLAAAIAGLRDWLDRLGIARPALEWGLAVLEPLRLDCPEIVLTHRDLRTGNYMVDEQGLNAILDWEFAGWGDPMADIGWFCAECWRFSRPDLEAGGIGSRAAFYAGYEAQSGRRIDPSSVAIWEIMAHIRWAVIALQQGGRHLSGAEPSLELALTGRIAPELELAVMRMTAPAALEGLGA